MTLEFFIETRAGIVKRMDDAGGVIKSIVDSSTKSSNGLIPYEIRNGVEYRNASNDYEVAKRELGILLKCTPKIIKQQYRELTKPSWRL